MTPPSEAYRDPSLPIETRISDLLNRMTVEEKMLQLIQQTIGKDANPENCGPECAFDPRVGSVLSFNGTVQERNAYQHAAVEKTRLGIPIVWGFDVIHGWRTIFPSPLAQACSFHPELTRKSCEAAAREAYYAGIDWTFSPMVDIPHDPRWGRVIEGYGEDPYTSGQFAAAAVKGYQGEEIGAQEHVAACLKHFCGYAASEGGRDYSYSDISRRALWEWYLPSFKAGIDAGALTLMSSFNDVTGIPAVANKYTLTEILREKWGFTGFVVSDWAGVVQLGPQGFSPDPEKQTIASLTAGTDMDMCDNVYRCIPKLIEEKRLSMEDLDLCVSRVLRVKFQLGLFEHPYTVEKKPEDVWEQPEARKLALEFARECMVLLKNEKELLPLNPAQYHDIALIGPMAENRRMHLGTWSWNADPMSAPTLLQTMRDFFPGVKLHTAKGCEFTGNDESQFDAAIQAAKEAELVILALGESDEMSGENCSKAELTLPGRQLELAKAIAALGKPVVLLTASGRPIAYPELADCAQAILHLWQGGCCGAEACWEIVTGKVNPSGKLAMTFPRGSFQIPMYYNSHEKARPYAGQYKDLTDAEQFPFYEFGYGLSYTSFAYGELKIDGNLNAEFTLTNTGKRAGAETVIWYISDPEATLTQPVRRVIAFEKVMLNPGESKTIRLKLDPMRDLSYPDDCGNRILEDGLFRLSAGKQNSAEFSYSK